MKPEQLMKLPRWAQAEWQVMKNKITVLDAALSLQNGQFLGSPVSFTQGYGETAKTTFLPDNVTIDFHVDGGTFNVRINKAHNEPRLLVMTNQDAIHIIPESSNVVRVTRGKY